MTIENPESWIENISLIKIFPKQSKLRYFKKMLPHQWTIFFYKL